MKAITHNDLYMAIDLMAKDLNTCRSGLCAAAGIDISALNKSREIIDGIPHWPTTKTIFAILNAFSISAEDFAKYITKAQNMRK